MSSFTTIGHWAKRDLEGTYPRSHLVPSSVGTSLAPGGSGPGALFWERGKGMVLKDAMGD